MYIGKSINIKQRVLSHLRAADEIKMMSQTRQVDYIETAGEIGALLLEAWLIKQHSPLYNIRLRRLRSLCTIRLVQSEHGIKPAILYSTDIEVGQVDGLYGLFTSAHAAQQKLRAIAAENKLCLGLMGLEKISQRGCFGVQIKHCLGACVGQEPRHEHDKRLSHALEALKIHVWPYPGAVEIVETQGNWVQRHRIWNWRYLGTWCSKSNRLSQSDSQGFDLDTYKIVVKPMMLETVRIERVQSVESTPEVTTPLN